MNKFRFSEYLTSFFTKYLPGQRGLSVNTIKAYRDTFVLLFRFLAQHDRLKPEKLLLDQFDRKMVERFLVWLEEEKNSAASTRNQRLAAIHAFIRYVLMECPELIGGFKDILSIQSKRTEVKAPSYLSIAELQTIFRQADTKTRHGRRDLALLALLYDSGARVQEIIDLQMADIRLDKPATIVLTGKGNKSRIVPVMPDTLNILSAYIAQLRKKEPDQAVFTNQSGDKLSRSGVEYIIAKYVDKAKESHPALKHRKVTPHVFRHSKAMHLTQANVNIVYIRDLLGHSSVQVTEKYARADSDMKRKAIEQASKNVLPELVYTKEKEQELMTFLKELL